MGQELHVPTREGHPHYPCLLVDSSDNAKLLQCIQEAMMTASWSLSSCERQKYHLDARIFYYGLTEQVTEQHVFSLETHQQTPNHI